MDPEIGPFPYVVSDAEIMQETPNSIPQSDEAKMSDFDVKAIEDKESTQLFVEGNTVVVGSTASTSNVDTYVEQEDTIKAFLGKPKLLINKTWLPGNPENLNIYNTDIGELLATTTMWADKIKGFRLFKGDFVITVRLNASAFQQGQLIMHYIPMYKHLGSSQYNMYNKHLSQKFQHPHVDISCRDTTVALRIPYIAPSHYYDLVDQKWSWGTVFIDVVAPLLTGSSAASTDVDLAIYGHWENVSLIAPTVPQSDKKTLRETKENKGSISEGLRQVEKVATMAKDIPIIGAYASQVSWAANIGAKLASAFGMSKPRELQGITTVANQTIKYHGTADGPNIATPGGVICENSLEPLDFLSVTKADEMSLQYLAKIPFYGGLLFWTKDTNVGVDLYNGVLVGPKTCSWTVTQTYNSKITTFEYPHPIRTISQMFKYYRGGMKLKLRFVKTEMHTGRLEVTYTPGPNPTNPTLSNSEYSMKTIVDIRGEDEIDIEFPFLLQSDYQTTDQYFGKLAVRVLDRLKAPETCAQTVNIIVLWSFAEDFELAGPQTQDLSLLPFIPQSDEDVLHSGSNPKMSDRAIGGLSVSHESLLHAKRCIGEKVMSIKQLLLRASPFTWYDVAGLGTGGWTLDPRACVGLKQNTTTGALVANGFGGDIYNILGPMYMFWRGGCNIHLTNCTSKTSTKLITGNLMDTPIISGSSNKNQTSTALWSINSAPIFPVNNNDGSINDMIQHVPYYNRFMCSPFRLYDLAQFPQLVDDYPTVNVSCLSGTDEITDLCVSRSVCDDFQLMFFINAPPVVTNYA